MSKRNARRLLSAAILIFVCALGPFAQPAVSQAAALTVITTADGGGGTLGNAINSVPAAASSGRNEIVFIDAAVHDAQILADSVQPGVEVVRLDVSGDGMTQIAAALKGRSAIDAIHIVSHGSAGQLHLGTTTLDLNGLEHYSSEVAAIRNALRSTADILLYGCSVAEGNTGKAFVRALSGATGAAVAASTDKTGAADKGGNALLEFSTGTIRSKVLAGLAQYGGSLAAITYTFDTTTEGWTGDLTTCYPCYFPIYDGQILCGSNAGSVNSYPPTARYIQTLDVRSYQTTGASFTMNAYYLGSVVYTASIAYNQGTYATHTINKNVDRLQFVNLGGGNGWFYPALDNVVTQDVVPNSAPTVTGSATTSINDQQTATPFSTLTVADADGDNVSLTITYTAANGTLSGTGLSGSAGSYTMSSAPAATITSRLQALVFTPTPNQVAPGSSVTTTFTVTPHDTWDPGSANSGCQVIATSLNDAPTGITISNNIVAKSAGVNGVVGTLSSTDPDTGDSHTYTLVTGTGDTNNALFNISGAVLRANDTLTIAQGWYSVRVQTTDSLGASYSRQMTIGVGVAAYPPITINNPTGNLYAYITNVKIGTIDNTSTYTSTNNQSAYSDYTGQSTNLLRGLSQSISVTIGGSDVSEQTVAVFFDWNQDGDFTDANETVTILNWASGGAAGGTTGGPYTASFTVPAGATPGVTRMRVVTDWRRDPLASGNIDYGEAEDYTVNIPNIVPTFVGATTLTVNQNASATDIKSLLHVSDTDGGQTETWTQSAGPSHGTLTFSGATASSGSTDITPGGTITYTPTPGYAGSDSFTVQVSDGSDSPTRTITVSVNQPPAITSANTTTLIETLAGAFTVTTTGFPTGASMVISKTGALPTGVTFTDNDNGTATLAGTPALGTNGNYPITITANNGVSPNATQNFTLVVQPNLQITSANNTTFIAGSAGIFTVTTSGTPTLALAESGSLPSGVTFTDNGDGTATLAGTPAAGTSGTYPITLTAHNGVAPDATQSFTLTVNQAPSVTTQPPDKTTCTGDNITFTAAAGGNPVPTVRWQLSTGSGFADISDGGVYSGAATPTLSITGATAGMDAYQYRAVFTNIVNSATTNAATLTVLIDLSITVSDTGDSGPGTLRQAIADICPGGTIDFGVTGTITLTSGELAIDKDMTISGPGAANLILDGGGTVQLFQVTGATSLTLQNLTLANGAAAGGGALIDNSTATTTITGCVFSGNMASIGGGAIFAAGTMTISDTYFSGNSTPVSYGGAIYAGSGTMTISNTLFSGNSAAGGGAITNSSATMTLTNVTMNGNSATAIGGGIFAGGGALDIVNATIDGNSATAPGAMGGGIAVSGGTVNLKNSIVADNTATSGPDIFGTVTSQGYNLIRTTTDATINGDTTGNIIGSNPLLSALADNGGSTRTMALLSGSPAINAAAGCPATDQRGISRPQGANCDIGAYEFVTGTTTTLGSSQNPSVYGQSVTFTAAVADSETGSVPAGTVTFMDSGTPIGSGTVTSSAQAVFSTMSLSPGSHDITAEYGGDTSFETSTSAPSTQTVNQAATTLTITSATPDPSVVGEPVTVTYTVTANPPGSGTPTGNVTVSDGVNNCTGTVAAGSCSITLSTSGVRTLTATYAGDANFNGSVSSSASHTVNKAGTTTTLTSHTSDPSVVGQAVTASYTVTANPPGSGTPTGNVTVSDGVNNCTGTVAAGSCSITLSTSGVRTLTATYAGDTNFYGSTSTGAGHTVNRAGTTTITEGNPDPSVRGQAVIVHFTVTANLPGSGTPTGSVTVTVSGGSESCTGTVAAGSCSIVLTVTGHRTLAASYPGDANFYGSTSSNVAHTVNEAPAITSINSSTFTVGASGFFTVTATGFPVPAISRTGASLPTGVTFVDNGNGTATLSGTPDPGTGGAYSMTFTASNGVSSNATQNFTLTVNSFDLNFCDDYGRTRLGVNSLTGEWAFTALGSPPQTFQGKGSFVRKGNILWMNTMDAERWGLNLVYNDKAKRAMATFGDRASGVRSSLIDTDTTDNPAGCD